MFDHLVARIRSLNSIVSSGLLGLALMASAAYVAYQEGTLVPLHALTIVLITLPLAFRRLNPIAVGWAVGLAVIANLALGFRDSFFETFAVLFALYTVVAYATWRPWLTASWVIGWIGLHVAILIDWHNHGSVNLADLPYNYLILALSLALGYGVRTRRAYIAQLEDRSRLLAREAAAEERNRIARELHDVIAHSVSVMVLQATAGGRVARRDAAGAAAAFEVIQETGRQALAELRRAVGILRGDSDLPAELLPQPGLAQLDELLEQVRLAGMKVDLNVTGEPRQLPVGVQLSVYRLVQESLTNVLKHADAAQAEVELRYEDTDVTVEIRDDGRGSNGSFPAGGHGLAGMRERVKLFGGELEAGPVDGGYRVRARLPLEPAAM